MTADALPTEHEAVRALRRHLRAVPSPDSAVELTQSLTQTLHGLSAIRLDLQNFQFTPDGEVTLLDGSAPHALLALYRDLYATLMGDTFTAAERGVLQTPPVQVVEYMRAKLDAIENIRQIRAYLGHALGEHDAEQLGVDLSMAHPDPAPRGPSVTLDLERM